MRRNQPRQIATHPRFALLCSFLFPLGACQGTPEAPVAVPPVVPEDRPNVLLICIDDLRPELGCYGADHVQSPNLDRFAAGALRFDRQYAQFPTCGASRYSFLTGTRPSLPAHYGNGAFTSLREQEPGAAPIATLPGSFRDAGYRTVCLGKVSHSHDGRTESGAEEMPEAWDSLPTDPGPWGHARHILHGYANGVTRVRGKSPISEAADVEDEAYPDGRLAAQAVEELRTLAAGEEPFFLAVGFFKPHLPFAAPKRYWDMYDPATLPLSTQPTKPTGLPVRNGWAQSGEVTGNYADAGYRRGVWSTSERRHLRHGYFACVSYVDAQVGKLLDELQRLELEDDTIVVVWGDHGWHLGDLGLFGKHTTFESALRSTLIVRVPGVTHSATSTSALVEALDIYPTLAELCSVPVPPDLVGRSFQPILADPDAKHRGAVRSYWRRGNWLGMSLRTARYRMVGWSDPITGRDGGIEVYELEPEGGASGARYEVENVAAREPARVRRLIHQYFRN